MNTISRRAAYPLKVSSGALLTEQKRCRAIEEAELFRRGVVRSAAWLELDVNMQTQPRGNGENVLPNPSFKRSANGMSHWPSSAGPAAHFALAVQRATPSSPA